MNRRHYPKLYPKLNERAALRASLIWSVPYPLTNESSARMCPLYAYLSDADLRSEDAGTVRLRLLRGDEEPA